MEHSCLAYYNISMYLKRQITVVLSCLAYYTTYLCNTISCHITLQNCVTQLSGSFLINFETYDKSFNCYGILLAPCLLQNKLDTCITLLFGTYLFNAIIYPIFLVNTFFTGGKKALRHCCYEKGMIIQIADSLI